MKSVELILLIITYSSLILTLFVSWICYRRNIEKWEIIAFIISLLLLTISMSFAELSNYQKTESTPVFILVPMILVGVTTVLSTLAERQHSKNLTWKKILFLISFILLAGTLLAFSFDSLKAVEPIVAIFLGACVVGSMLFIRYTKPIQVVAHLEKTNRIFAILFLIFVPLSLLATYGFENMGYQFQIGLFIPVLFTLLALSKLFDDLQRLSLIKPNIEADKQHFKNYALSTREIEITNLLIQGRTYKHIAEELFVSVSTVKTHSSNIYKKCKVNNRHELTVLISN